MLLLAVQIVWDLVWHPALSTVSSVKFLIHHEKTSLNLLRRPNFLRVGALYRSALQHRTPNKGKLRFTGKYENMKIITCTILLVLRCERFKNHF